MAASRKGDDPAVFCCGGEPVGRFGAAVGVRTRHEVSFAGRPASQGKRIRKGSRQALSGAGVPSGTSPPRRGSRTDCDVGRHRRRVSVLRSPRFHRGAFSVVDAAQAAPANPAKEREEYRSILSLFLRRDPRSMKQLFKDQLSRRWKAPRQGLRRENSVRRPGRRPAGRPPQGRSTRGPHSRGRGGSSPSPRAAGSAYAVGKGVGAGGGNRTLIASLEG